MAFELLLVALPQDTWDIGAALGQRIRSSPAADRIFFWKPGSKRVGDAATDAELGLAGTDWAGDVCRVGQFPRGHIVHHLIGPAGDYHGLDLDSCVCGDPPNAKLDPDRFTRLAAEWLATVERVVSEWPPDWLAVEVYASV